MANKHERAWVFVDDDTGEEVGEAPEDNYVNADDAMHGFAQEYAGHFGVFFRTEDGTLHPCADESEPGDF